jgi:hypothetical protein
MTHKRFLLGRTNFIALTGPFLAAFFNFATLMGKLKEAVYSQ